MARKTKDETVAVQEAFLAVYGECGTIRTACKAANVSRATVYRWIDTNAHGFKEKQSAAYEIFKDYLQDLALERIKGQGPKDNPMLLMSYLNAHLPELFKRNATGTDSVAKDIMAELKRWRKDADKDYKEARDAEEIDAKKNAIDQVEKILSRKRDSDDNIQQS
jgi:hypothetical protein